MQILNYLVQVCHTDILYRSEYCVLYHKIGRHADRFSVFFRPLPSDSAMLDFPLWCLFLLAPHRAQGKNASERIALRAHGFALVRHDSVFIKTYRHHHFLHHSFPFIISFCHKEHKRHKT